MTPEIHYIEEEFYIYYATAYTKNEHEYDKAFQHRLCAIKCTGQNAMEDEWIECGQIVTRQDSFCSDGTVCQIPDKNYYIWSQKK